MARKDDSELDTWRLRYPSAGVSWNLIGDQVSCLKFMGYAKIMLYQLKNRMNLAVPKLKSLQDKRSPEPGTTITVKSIYGQDFIEISTGVGVEGGKEICTITFIDFPLYVPPMRNPGEIKVGEMEGVDYFKTYYSVDKHKCRTCGEISWEFLFRYLQSSPLVPATVPISTRVEWPIEPLHHHDYDVDGLLLDHDGTDHTIYSMAPPAWGEVISQGGDGKGTYIIWKAYTETVLTGAEHIPLSRSGLGIMRLVARIKNNMGIEICAQNERIEVDCCLKDPSRRIIQIWDESTTFGGGRESVFIGEDVFYKTPTQVNLADLQYYALWGSGAFFVFPEGFGGCLPIQWELTGPGWLEEVVGQLVTKVKSKIGVSASYILPDDWATACQNQRVSIKASDRCGSPDLFSARPCCEVPGSDEMTIGYITLLMGCNDEQTFDVTGGCPPYSWAVTSGGGSIVGSGPTAVYTAPATNVNCLNNPTIEVTDCCGNSAEIKLAVNCGGVGGTALTNYYKDGPHDCRCTEYYGGNCITMTWEGQFFRRSYDCSGAETSYAESTYGTYTAYGYPFAGYCEACGACCATYVTCGSLSYCEQGCGLFDMRSVEQKEAGCCPINPLTGLPY